MDISTYQELRKQLQEEIKLVIDRVAKRVSEDLAKRIDQDVYESHSPNKDYFDKSKQPTYQFRDEAWPWTDATSKGIRQVVKELYYDGSRMAYKGNKFLHGSNIDGWGDARRFLAEILNQDSKLSSLWITKERPANAAYWDNFLGEIFGQDRLSKYFFEELKKSGLDVYK